MPVVERDDHSGYLTTGHEWNGIKELNTPVPRLVYAALIVTTLFAIGYWLLMPAFPLGSTYTKGLLGANDRTAVSEAVAQAKVDRSTWADQVANKSFAEVEADPKLLAKVREAGRTLFGDNCSVCHGREAKGNVGFPNLTTTAWLWGGSPEAIAETIRVGINSTHPNSRNSQMPSFGRDGMLKRDEMENVIAYVLSLSRPTTAPPDKIAAGKTIFAANCASCHGPDAKGNPEIGTPNLTDANWTHGSDENALYTVVWGGLQGHMPSWEGRLSPLDRKLLAYYLVDLRRPKP